MAPRPYWKGYLKLSLVSCSIALSPATSSSERVSFRQINRKTGNLLRQQLVDDETREPVDAAHKGKGYEVAKNEYLLIDDDELDALEIESNHTIEIDRFVPAAQIDKRFYDTPYYVTPNDSVGQEAFAVIRDAMKGKGMVALGRVVMAKRERVIALEPSGKGLLGTTLLAYGFGLRHAVDADHIAEIDNVSRKLMQEGKRPATAGLWFSLGHSTVVMLASLAIAATTSAFRSRIGALESIGGVVGTLVSALLLLLIAAMNTVILVTVYRTFRRVRAGAPYRDEELNVLLAGRGVLARLFRPLFRAIRRSWHMYPLGLLFGIGFSTATEIGLLGISAAQAALMFLDAAFRRRSLATLKQRLLASGVVSRRG